MATYDQTNRILAFTSSLGTDMAVLTDLEGEEAISRPFEFRIRFATDAEAATVTAMLGTAVTLSFGRADEPESGPTGQERRPLNGIVRRLARTGITRGETAEWRAEVVPKLWLLSRTTDCRIFQDQTVPQIVEAILGEHSVTFRNALTGTYAALPYCVQYRETALDFISRLMEQHGIFYWHEHSESGHKLVIGDDNGSTPASPYDDLVINPRPEAGGILRLDEEFAVRSATWAMRDFNFETPTNTLEVSVPTKSASNPAGTGEFYDYPGLYKDSGGGRTVASVLMEHEESLYHLRRGASVVAGMDAGMRVTISEPGTTAGSTVAIADSEVLVTEIRHRGEDFSHWTPERWGRQTPRAPFYENEFVCLPKKVPFRPARATSKPFVRGPQTAIVTGPSGEEIHTDKYGRVKVKFHWDRVNPSDDTSSCWVRVSQGWAGANWGQIHIPRMGHEVIVDFLEGDPDRPIITGRVYNADNTVPYTLPANKTQSGIKTRSSQGGGAADFNELRFEDKKGSEQVYLHAQKDLDSVVENNETRHVMKNRETKIDVDETTKVGGNKTTEVTGNFDEKVQGTETRNITGNVSETFLANEDRSILGNHSETVTGNVTQTVTGSHTQTVVGSMTKTVTGGITITTPATINVNAVGGWTLIAPGGTTTIDNKFFKTGLDDLAIYAFQLTHAAVQMNACATMAMSFMNNKMDIQNLKIEFGSFKFGNDGTEIKNASTAIKQGALNLVTFGFIALS